MTRVVVCIGQEDSPAVYSDGPVEVIIIDYDAKNNTFLEDDTIIDFEGDRVWLTGYIPEIEPTFVGVVFEKLQEG